MNAGVAWPAQRELTDDINSGCADTDAGVPGVSFSEAEESDSSDIDDVGDGESEQTDIATFKCLKQESQQKLPGMQFTEGNE